MRGLDRPSPQPVATHDPRTECIRPERRSPPPREGRFRSWYWRRSMNTIGVLLLAAATAGDGFGYSKPGVGLKKLLRPHVVAHGPAPPGGPIAPGPGLGAGAGMGAGVGGCGFGHPGCAGGSVCPGGGGPGGGGPGGRRFGNVRSQIYFLDPDGMRIGWQTGGDGPERVYLPAQLTVPARYNFMRGYIY